MRKLDTFTLDNAAKYYAAEFARRPEWVAKEFHKFTFKDEFDHLCRMVKEFMSRKMRGEWERVTGNYFTPRSDNLLAKLLGDKLAVDMEGAHIPGTIGTTKVGGRLIGSHEVEVETPESIKWNKTRGFRKGSPQYRRDVYSKVVPLIWPIYAGETEERLAGSDVVDEFPEGTPSMAVGALNTRISNECAILACDAIVDNLDEGTGAAVVQGRSGAQPADPDTAVTGTLLFQLTCSATAFGGASDAAPGATATAAAVTDDTSADATNTVGYCRASSTNDGATPLDDHIDGEAGTSGADFNFNTTSIVSGSTVSLTTWTVTMPES